MRFVFSRDQAEPASSFVLGDLEVAGPDGSVTSAGRTPDQSFMIYVGMADLAHGLLRLADGTRREYEFVGPDSSFIIVFRRRRDRISATAYRRSLGEAPAGAVVAGLRAGIDAFLADPANVLDPTEIAAIDLAAALAALHA